MPRSISKTCTLVSRQFTCRPLPWGTATSLLAGALAWATSAPADKETWDARQEHQDNGQVQVVLSHSNWPDRPIWDVRCAKGPVWRVVDSPKLLPVVAGPTLRLAAGPEAESPRAVELCWILDHDGSAPLAACNAELELLCGGAPIALPLGRGKRTRRLAEIGHTELEKHAMRLEFQVREVMLFEARWSGQVDALKEVRITGEGGEQSTREAWIEAPDDHSRVQRYFFGARPPSALAVHAHLDSRVQAPKLAMITPRAKWKEVNDRELAAAGVKLSIRKREALEVVLRVHGQGATRAGALRIHDRKNRTKALVTPRPAVTSEPNPTASEVLFLLPEDTRSQDLLELQWHAGASWVPAAVTVDRVAAVESKPIDPPKD